MFPNITVAETLNPSWPVAEPLSSSPLSYAFVHCVLRPCHCRALEQAACRLFPGPKPKPRVFVGSPVLHENPGFGKTHAAQEGTQAVALGGKKTAAPPFALSSPSAVGLHLHRALSQEQAPHALVQRPTHVSMRSQRRVPRLLSACVDINQNQLNCPPSCLQFVVSSGHFFHFVPDQLLKLVTSLSTQSPCRLQGVSVRLRQRQHRKALL